MESTFGRMPTPPAVSSLSSTPSYSQSLAFSRMPCAETDMLPRYETSLLGPCARKLPARPVTVPGPRRASCTKLRPFRGNSATCCALMSWPSEASLRCSSTAAAWLVTVTSVDSEEICSTKSSVRLACTSRTTLLRSWVWKPVIEALRV